MCEGTLKYRNIMDLWESVLASRLGWKGRKYQNEKGALKSEVGKGCIGRKPGSEIPNLSFV